MDLNLIRILVTVALFVIFLVLIVLLFKKRDTKIYKDAANLPFVGDDTSDIIESKKIKGENHE